MDHTKILICGDSFAVDQTAFDPMEIGWSSMLAKDFLITNSAQAGISEYKILKQLTEHNLDDYDIIIVSHTSPYRVHIKNHPLYQTNQRYKNADLIYNDVLAHYNNNPRDAILSVAKNYFENIFDQDYYHDIYFLLVNEIKKITHGRRCLHLLTMFDQGLDITPVLNLKQKFKFKQGTPNHYSNKDNIEIFNLIKNWIRQTDE